MTEDLSLLDNITVRQLRRTLKQCDDIADRIDRFGRRNISPSLIHYNNINSDDDMPPLETWEQARKRVHSNPDLYFNITDDEMLETQRQTDLYFSINHVDIDFTCRANLSSNVNNGIGS